MAKEDGEGQGLEGSKWGTGGGMGGAGSAASSAFNVWTFCYASSKVTPWKEGDGKWVSG